MLASFKLVFRASISRSSRCFSYLKYIIFLFYILPINFSIQILVDNLFYFIFFLNIIFQYFFFYFQMWVREKKEKSDGEKRIKYYGELSYSSKIDINTLF